MSTDRTLVVVSAGLSQPSSTRLLADRLSAAAARELQSRGHGVSVENVELRDHAHAVVDAMLTGFPTGELARAMETLTRADGVIAVTPLFTTTYSGLFKSFVDIVDPDALTGMPVLLGATGGTPRHSLALEYSLRPLFTYLHADVVPTSVFAATDDWAGEGDRVNPLPRRIERAGRELAERVAARRNEGPADPFANAPSFSDLLGSA
ncbi:FMN reductase [Isoptericola variabilis]|uniref:NADPH-dependent FMN reductase n=1 Tax=Isoptericola variabilis (strain 225) TaxID=743718 RepID=F6FUW8_ISOV2|nr:FMN reductase [Isoptericola variabilis]AEG44308.1 NADPH-dependent FMN reductase [Isoptericola variabilis 225]TWH31104.1 FMN reductase [Isoptericola variabilis J7]